MKFLITLSLILCCIHLNFAQKSNSLPQHPENSINLQNKIVQDSLYQAAKKNVSLKEDTHHFSFFVGGGLSTFTFKPELGDLNNRLGITIGADYTYYWHPNWGISAGVTFDRFNSSLSYHQDSVYYPSIDTDGAEFVLISNFNNLEETQKTWVIGIPVEIRYKLPINQIMGFFGGIGPKLSTSLTSSSQVVTGSYSTKGFYLQYGSNTIIPPGTGPGFDTYAPRDKVSSSVGFSISMISDIDFYYKLTPAIQIYGGPYFEYQLNKTTHNEEKPIIEYHVVSQSEAFTTYNTGITDNAPTGAKKMAIGAKVGVILDLGGAKIIKQMKAERDTRELLRVAEMQRKATEDSLANAALLAIRQRVINDSIVHANQVAEESRRKAELALLAEQKRINDSIVNAQAKNVTVVMDVRTNKLSEDELSVLKLPIIYNFGSAELSNQSKANAQKIGEVLARHPDLELIITGHTCDIGNENYNYQLGLRRAKSLNNEFITAGVIATQISTHSKGETEPLLPNIDEMNRQKNRRVVCIIKD